MDTAVRDVARPNGAEGGSVAGGLSVTNLTVQFGSKVVLRSLDLEMPRGEFLTVLGRSGCGKSTLLRFIAGFTPSRTGRLSINGRDLTEAPPHRRNLGLLFQNYALFPHMSVSDNVAFGLKARGVRGRDAEAKVAAALKAVQLGDSGHLRPAALSGGMQQRVALARALVIEPDILLLDEPLSALDANLRAAVRTELKALHERLPNLSIICVTHDQEDALVLSDRTLLMRDGHIAQLGTPQELYDAPRDRFVAAYLGQANFLPSALALPAIGLAPQGERYACLRPEHLRVEQGEDGPLTGTVSGIEWHGATQSLFLHLDRAPETPVLVALPRSVAAPERGARVSLRYRPEDVIVVDP
jgi:2-aminoethylphosphonate transport system ATP-binding protein